MTHASDRKNRKQKKRKWKQRGGGGIQRTGSPGSDPSRGAIGKLSPFWQTVVGLLTLGLIVGAVVMIGLAIFG